MHENIVAAPELAGEGLQKIEWVRRNMPILRKIQSEFEKEQPFAGKRITVCIHLEAKTAFLALVLRSGGAQVLSPEVILNQPKTMSWRRLPQKD